MSEQPVIRQLAEDIDPSGYLDECIALRSLFEAGHQARSGALELQRQPVSDWRAASDDPVESDHW